MNAESNRRRVKLIGASQSIVPAISRHPTSIPGHFVPYNANLNDVQWRDPWEVCVAALLEVNQSYVLVNRYVFGEINLVVNGLNIMMPHFSEDGHTNGGLLPLEIVALIEKAMRLGFDAYPDADYTCRRCEIAFGYYGIDHQETIKERTLHDHR